MAETDGTPRYRKSKPPNAKGGGSGRSSRNTRPNGKARKRAELNSTLPSGASLDQVAKVDSEPERAEPAQVNAEKSEGHVVKTIPTIIRTEPAAAAAPVPDALAETHAELENSGSRSKPQRGPNPSMLRSKRPLLASTLRMELTVRRNEGSEPEISVRPSPSFTDGDGSDGRSFPDAHDGATTLSESAPRSRKPTAAGGYGHSPTYEDVPTRPRERPAAARSGAAERSQPLLDDTMRRGSDISTDSLPNMHSPRPRRARRPGERTLIMTRRDPKRSSKRDWLFVVMLVAALGLTASMFLSRQTPAESDEVVDASEYEDPQDEQQPDPFATTLQPYKAKPAARADTPAQPAQTESSISASTIQATELRSLPSGAEVVAGEAVVGSTPVRVARGSTEMTYMLRMPGHEPKVVRVGPQSPASIMVELTRTVSAAPATPPGMFGHVGGVQPPEPPADVPATANNGR